MPDGGDSAKLLEYACRSLAEAYEPCARVGHSYFAPLLDQEGGRVLLCCAKCAHAVTVSFEARKGWG